MRLLISLVLIFLSACVDVDDASTTQELQQGPPRIISTTIVGVTPSGGVYQLDYGSTYQVRVIVDSGTITYQTRTEPHELPSSVVMSPAQRDETISANSGTRTYTYWMTPYYGGDFQLAFHIKDRPTGNVYDINGGVAVRVVIRLPRIISTTINAPILDGRYQLDVGQIYTSTVVVASGNVTYNVSLEGNGNAGLLGQSPGKIDATIDRFSANRSFTFTFRPSEASVQQVGFRLRDRGTGNIFDVNPGVAVLARGVSPQIVSTTIDAPWDGFRYQLTVGRRYLVRVRVASGTVTNVASVMTNTQGPPPAWAHLHDRESSLWRFVPNVTAREFVFTVAPERTGYGQVAFMLHDCPPGTDWDGVIYNGTSNPYGANPGVIFQATSDGPGIHGTVTTTAGAPLAGATVAIAPTYAAVTTGADGSFAFTGLPSGTYKLAVARSGYSPSYAVNIPYTGEGFRSDVAMEVAMPDLTSVGINYLRYHDRSEGLTVMHVVEVPRATTRSAFIEGTWSGSGILDFQTPSSVALQHRPRVLINGGFFDASNARAVGYYFRNGFWPSDPMVFPVEDPNPLTPVFGIVGNGLGQSFRIALKSNNFTLASASDWNNNALTPLWDDDRNGWSDVSYATQNDAILNNGSTVPAWDGHYAKHWARTAVGISPSGDLLLVAADGEGIHGVQGAGLSQLGRFFRDHLSATISMNWDGGGSTVLLLKEGSGYRMVTRNAAENPRWSNPSSWGVLNYLGVW